LAERCETLRVGAETHREDGLSDAVGDQPREPDMGAVGGPRRVRAHLVPRAGAGIQKRASPLRDDPGRGRAWLSAGAWRAPHRSGFELPRRGVGLRESSPHLMRSAPPLPHRPPSRAQMDAATAASPICRSPKYPSARTVSRSPRAP